MKKELNIFSLKGQAAIPYVDRLAAVRTRVFSDFPYLYAGDLDYERNYLKTYFSSEHSFIVIVLDGDQVVGASTAIWLPEADGAFQKPFLEKGIHPRDVCYYGESVLLGDYRGYGVGKEFMQRREQFARSLKGVKMVAFCAVQRPKDHPRRPADYRPLDEFWKATGFEPQPDMIAHYAWKDHGDAAETDKPLMFWTKQLKYAVPFS